jgi:hypothetical protein
MNISNEPKSKLEKEMMEELRKQGINPDLINDSYGDEFEDGIDEHYGYTKDNTSEYGDDSYEY